MAGALQPLIRPSVPMFLFRPGSVNVGRYPPPSHPPSRLSLPNRPVNALWPMSLKLTPRVGSLWTLARTRTRTARGTPTTHPTQPSGSRPAPAPAAHYAVHRSQPNDVTTPDTTPDRLQWCPLRCMRALSTLSGVSVVDVACGECLNGSQCSGE